MNYIYVGKQPTDSLVGAVSIFYFEDGNLHFTQTMQAWLNQENWKPLASTLSPYIHPEPIELEEIKQILNETSNCRR